MPQDDESVRIHSGIRFDGHRYVKHTRGEVITFHDGGGLHRVFSGRNAFEVEAVAAATAVHTNRFIVALADQFVAPAADVGEVGE